MAGIRYANRVEQTSATTGTGTFDLDATIPDGFAGFVATVRTGAVVPYHAEGLDASGNPNGEYESGFGTVTDATPDTLSRDRVEESSNSHAKVNFSGASIRIRLAPTARQVSHFPKRGHWGYAGPTSGSTFAGQGRMAHAFATQGTIGVTADSDGYYGTFTAASYMGWYTGRIYTPSGTPFMLAQFQLPSTSNLRFFCGFSYANPGTAQVDADDPTNDHLGLEFTSESANFRWVSYDGTTRVEEDSGVAASTATFFVEVEWVSASLVVAKLFDADGALLSSKAWTASIPTNAGSAMCLGISTSGSQALKCGWASTQDWAR